MDTTGRGVKIGGHYREGGKIGGHYREGSKDWWTLQGGE